MLYLPGGGAMLFLTDVDHVSFEKANETRQNNLQSATVSLQVVITRRFKRALLPAIPAYLENFPFTTYNTTQSKMDGDF